MRKRSLLELASKQAAVLVVKKLLASKPNT